MLLLSAGAFHLACFATAIPDSQYVMFSFHETMPLMLICTAIKPLFSSTWYQAPGESKVHFQCP